LIVRHRKHVEHEQRHVDPAALVQHPCTEAVKVRPAALVERNEFPIDLHVYRQRIGELAEQRRHVPAAPGPVR
jgi:hypothetical protein